MTATVTPPTSRAGEALLRSSNPEIRRLAVKETDEVVEVIGVVSCFYLKQLAIESVRQAAAGRRITNRVIVCRENAPATDSFC